MRGLRRPALRLGLVLASVCMALGVCEVVLRFTPYRKLLHAPPRYHFRADAEAGYDLHENAPLTRHTIADTEYDIWSNELGCFDRPYQGEPGPILLVGDSFTHYYAPFEDKWGTRLEELLGLRVLKCGVSGYGTRQELIKARRLLQKVPRPRLLLVGYFTNDFRDDVLFPEESVSDGWRVTTVRLVDVAAGTLGPTRTRQQFGYHLRLNSIVYNLGKRAYEACKSRWADREPELPTDFGLYPETLYTAPYVWVPQALEQHLQNLLQFRLLAESAGAELCVLLFPAKEQLYPSLLEAGSRTVTNLEQANAVVLDFLERHGIACIPLFPLMQPYADPTPRKALDPEADLYWKVDGHLNVRGNRLVGLLVARELLHRGLVQPRDRAGRLEQVERELQRENARGGSEASGRR